MDWNKIKAEYIAGGTSYRKLCAKYGVSRTTLQRKAKDEKWLDLRSQAEAKAETKIVEDISNQSAKTDKKYYSLVDKLMQRAEEVIENTPVWSVNAIKEMSTALKYLKECKGVKSDIDLREQEARIRNLEKQAEGEVTDTTVIVQFEEDISKWSR